MPVIVPGFRGAAACRRRGTRLGSFGCGGCFPALVLLGLVIVRFLFRAAAVASGSRLFGHVGGQPAQTGEADDRSHEDSKASQAEDAPPGRALVLEEIRAEGLPAGMRTAARVRKSSKCCRPPLSIPMPKDSGCPSSGLRTSSNGLASLLSSTALTPATSHRRAATPPSSRPPDRVSARLDRDPLRPKFGHGPPAGVGPQHPAGLVLPAAVGGQYEYDVTALVRIIDGEQPPNHWSDSNRGRRPPGVVLLRTTQG